MSENGPSDGTPDDETRDEGASGGGSDGDDPAGEPPSDGSTGGPSPGEQSPEGATAEGPADPPAETLSGESTPGERAPVESTDDAPPASGESAREPGGETVAEGWGRSLAYLGYGAVIVGFGGVLAAMVLTPWFSVFSGALSVLGFRRVAVAPLFNGSLIVGGALGTGLVAALWATAEQPFHLAAVPFLFLATVSMSLVGVFPLPTGPHVLVSAAFFSFLTVGVLLWGVGDYAPGRGGRAATFLLLPAVHVVAWAWWFVLPWAPRGIALPELAGVAALVVWALWVSADLHGLTADPLPV